MRNTRLRKKAAFEYVDATTCYACGQPLPAATIEEARRAARESFEKHQREILDKLIADAKSRKGYLQQVNKAGFDHRTGNRNDSINAYRNCARNITL